MLVWIVSLPFIAAAAAPLVHRALGRWTGWVLGVVPVAVVAGIARQLPMDVGEQHVVVWPWVPAWGVNFALRLDGLSATFALLIAGIGALIVVYATGYLRGDPRQGRFFAYLLAFMGAMLGVVLADDLFTLFVFWELTSITSYLLIGFNHDRQESRDAALQALLVTGGGGLALLAGLVLLQAMGLGSGLPAEAAGRISALTALNPETGRSALDLSGHGLYPAALVLILLGAFTKSAQFPFHFWLPSAMAAPTPVSAYLHSATMVKAGVYLLARLLPALGGTELWHVLVTGVGGVTMVAAAALATGQHDLKRILAFTTVSVLGTLTMLLGLGTALAVKAVVVFLVAHALYKAALFLVAGNVDHETGSRDVTRLGGLLRLMPLTAVAAFVAALSMAGAPPLFGFIGKELLLKAKLDLETAGLLLMVLAVLANMFMVAMALVVATWPFFGQRAPTPREPHEAPPSMLAGPLLLAGLSVCVGLLPGWFERQVGSAMGTAILGQPLELKLKLIELSPEGLAALVVSAVSLGLGLWVYFRLPYQIEHTARWAGLAEAWGPATLYQRSLSGLIAGAGWLTGLLQSGYLRRYVIIVVVVMIVLVAYPLISGVQLQRALTHWDARPHEVALAGLALAGAVVAAVVRSRLTAVAALGVTGAIALLLAIFSAPDLAMTLVMVETLTVILLVLVFYHLPSFAVLRTRVERVRDLVVALAGGAMMTLLVLAAATVRMEPWVSTYYKAAAWPEALGRNVVNVILVDFRALDTLGEIVVVAVAGVGVYALLRLRPRTRAREGRR
jgi:multicomponent Na+:H+ antiporter subunit A